MSARWGPRLLSGERQMRVYRSGIRQNPHRTVGILANSTTTGKKPSAARLKDLDEPFALGIVLKDRILDVCIDNRRTFIARRPEDSGLSSA